MPAFRVELLHRKGAEVAPERVGDHDGYAAASEQARRLVRERRLAADLRQGPRLIDRWVPRGERDLAHVYHHPLRQRSDTGED